MIRFGLLGKNITKSLSKDIHECILKEKYDLISVDSENEFSQCLKSEFNFLNITNPFKLQALNACDVIDEVAKSTNAVNLIIKKNNKLYGYNTDCFGFAKLLEKNDINVNGKACLILGTGCTSKSVKFVLENQGAKSIKFLSRNPKNINEYMYDNLSVINEAEILINTTPVGAFSNGEDLPLIEDVKLTPNLKVYIDVNYLPNSTNQAWLFKRNGIKCVNGLTMLISQAIKSDEIYLNKDIYEEKYNEICTKIIAKQRNIVLIGGPLSGKTTIGKKLAESLQMTFVDTDELIENKEGKITEIFANKGEEYFRESESETISEISNDHGLIIATGGGSVLNKENIRLLRKNGIVICLNRRLDTFSENDIKNRPLLKDKNSLNKLMQEREILYKNYADLYIENDDIDSTLERIKNAL